MDALAALVWSNSTRLRMLRLPFVGSFKISIQCEVTNIVTAKFTGYQYGGRPLGLTFVKYVNPGAGDVMEGAEPTGAIAQDQIM